MKKFLSLTMTFTLLLSMIACDTDTVTSQSSTPAGSSGTAQVEDANFNATGLPIVDEPVTLTVLALTNYPESPAEDFVFWNSVQEATNVNIEWEVIPYANWAEKKGLVLSRSELPDIMLSNDMFSDADVLNMADAGQIIPLNDYLDEYGEYWDTLVEREPTLVPSITASDGNIYGLPTFSSPDAANNTHTPHIQYLNNHWLGAVGLDMPTTLDEFETALIAFKNDDPNGNGIADEIPYTSTENNNVEYYDDFFGAFGLLLDNNALKVENLGMKDGVPIFTPFEEDAYKAGINYLNSLWTQGLLDPETFTQDSAMFNAKLKSPTRIAGGFAAWRGTAWRLENEYSDEYLPLPALEGPDGEKAYQRSFSGVKARGAAVVSSTCENPEVAVRFLDYLLEDLNALQMQSQRGLGYHLEENGDGTLSFLTDIIDWTNPDDVKQVNVRFTCISAEAMDLMPVSENPLDVAVEINAALPYYEDALPTESYPSVFLTLEESEVVSELQSTINEFVNQKYAEWITTDGVSDDEYAEFVQILNDMEVQRYMEQYISAYDRYMAAA